MSDDPARRMSTPVGVECLYCGEAVAEGDSGYAMPYVGDPDGVAVRAQVPDMVAGVVVVVEHRECMAAQTVGHLVGVCSCTGWTTGSRATALEVQRRIDRRLDARA